MTTTPTLSIDELIALFDDFNDRRMMVRNGLRAIKARIKRLEGAIAELWPPNQKNDDGSWTIFDADFELDAALIDLDRTKVLDPVIRGTLRRVLGQLSRARAALADTSNGDVAQQGERRALTPDVAGSSPAVPTSEAKP